MERPGIPAQSSHSPRFTDLNFWPTEALRYERVSVGVCALCRFSGPHIIAKCWFTVCDSNGCADTHCVSSWQALKLQEGFMWITRRLLVHAFLLLIKALADVGNNATLRKQKEKQRKRLLSSVFSSPSTARDVESAWLLTE